MKKDNLLKGLKHFLKESSQADYATVDSKSWIKESDSSTTIKYESGDWKFHDNFFGGEPYGGRTIVHFEDKPVWMFIYYGAIKPEVTKIQEVYDFLKEALRADPHKVFRGPKNFKKGRLTYKNSWKGGLEKFFGEEAIYESKKEIYSAKYMGGLVDQRRDEETNL